MPPVTVSDSESRTKDRHKARRTISYEPTVYLLLKHLAQDINHRPLLWEAKMLAIAHLKEAGLWPADPALLEELRRKDAEEEPS